MRFRKLIITVAAAASLVGFAAVPQAALASDWPLPSFLDVKAMVPDPAAPTTSVIGLRRNQLVRLSFDGREEILAGQREKGTTDGLASEAKFHDPSSLAIDHNGDIYIADGSNNRIRKYDPKTRRVSTISGAISVEEAGIKDGPAEQATFAETFSIVIDNTRPDRMGKIVISCSDRIRELDLATNRVTTIAGPTTPHEQRAFADGVGDAVRFNHPIGIALDKDGTIAITDTENHRIRSLDPRTRRVDTIAGNGEASPGDGPPEMVGFTHPLSVGIIDDDIYIGEAGGVRRFRRSNGLVCTVSPLPWRGIFTSPADRRVVMDVLPWARDAFFASTQVPRSGDPYHREVHFISKDQLEKEISDLVRQPSEQKAKALRDKRPVTPLEQMRIHAGLTRAGFEKRSLYDYVQAQKPAPPSPKPAPLPAANKPVIDWSKQPSVQLSEAEVRTGMFKAVIQGGNLFVLTRTETDGWKLTGSALNDSQVANATLLKAGGRLYASWVEGNSIYAKCLGCQDPAAGWVPVNDTNPRGLVVGLVNGLKGAPSLTALADGIAVAYSSTRENKSETFVTEVYREGRRHSTFVDNSAAYAVITDKGVVSVFTGKDNGFRVHRGNLREKQDYGPSSPDPKPLHEKVTALGATLTATSRMFIAAATQSAVHIQRRDAFGAGIFFPLTQIKLPQGTQTVEKVSLEAIKNQLFCAVHLRTTTSHQVLLYEIALDGTVKEVLASPYLKQIKAGMPFLTADLENKPVVTLQAEPEGEWRSFRPRS